jgi:hypothetical protein
VETGNESTNTPDGGFDLPCVIVNPSALPNTGTDGELISLILPATGTM